jgi:hypothetical protein
LKGRISTTSIGQRKQVQGGGFGGSSKRVIFLGKGKRRMNSLSRWWKKGEWVGCLGYFKRIKVNRIILGA